MCTVSLVPAGDRLRLLCNRDERHTRPAARPPVVTRAGHHLAMLPLDPMGGGTWVAATAAGLAFAVLNGPGTPSTSALSRGRLILELLDASSLDEVTAAARGLCRRDWPAHRLLAVDEARVLDIRVGLAGLQVHEQSLRRPLMFTSSSASPEQAAGVRRELFAQLMSGADDPFDAQDAFHRHRWPDRPHLSVHMRRHDAATQSITMVEIGPSTVRMRYESTTDLVGLPAMLSVDRVCVHAGGGRLWRAASERLPALAVAS